VFETDQVPEVRYGSYRKTETKEQGKVEGEVKVKKER